MAGYVTGDAAAAAAAAATTVAVGATTTAVDATTAAVVAAGAPGRADYLQAVSLGMVAGARIFRIPGLNGAVSSAALDDISEIGVDVVPDPGGVQLSVRSTSGADIAGGAGIRSVEVHYLDASFLEQSETVITNGAGLVNTVAVDIECVQWMHAMAVGGTGVAVGDVTLEALGGGAVYEQISAGGNQSLSARFCVPAGTTGYIVDWSASGMKKRVDLRLRATVQRFARTLLPGVFLFQDTASLENSTSGTMPLAQWLACPAQARVKVSGISDAAGGEAATSFSILLIDD